jgi:hypothetical protein
MIQAAKIIGTGLATTGLIGAGVGIQGIKFFSTSNYLGVDKGEIAEQINTNAASDEQETEQINTNAASDEQETKEVNTNSGSHDQSGDETNPGSDDGESDYETNPGSDGESGYETNSDRSELDNDPDAMLNFPAQGLPDDMLKQFKKEVKDIYRNFLRSGEEELRQTFTDRHIELKTERERRIANGTMSDNSSSVDTDPSTPAASPAASLELQSSPKVEHNEEEKDKSSGNSYHLLQTKENLKKIQNLALNLLNSLNKIQVILLVLLNLLILVAVMINYRS